MSSFPPPSLPSSHQTIYSICLRKHNAKRRMVCNIISQHTHTHPKKRTEGTLKLLKCSIWIFCSTKRLTDCYDYFSSSSLSSTIPSWCFSFVFLCVRRMFGCLCMVLRILIRSRSLSVRTITLLRLSALSARARVYCSFVVHSQAQAIFIQLSNIVDKCFRRFFGYWNLLYFLGAMNSSICIYIHYQNRSRVWERVKKIEKLWLWRALEHEYIIWVSANVSKNSVYTWWWALTSGQTNWTFSNVDIFATKWGWTGYEYALNRNGYEYAVFDSLMNKIRLNPPFAI